MSEWQPIETPPDSDTVVVVFFANRVWWCDSDRTMPAPSFGLVRDFAERAEVAFFQNGTWCEAGTGHDLFEDWRQPDNVPTHWMPLPKPPGAAE